MVYLGIFRCIWVKSHAEFEDIKGVIRRRKLKKDRHNNVQKKKDNQRSTICYTENLASSNLNRTPPRVNPGAP